MTEKKEEEKEKKRVSYSFDESLTSNAIRKRMTIEIPEDLKEPPTPGPAKTTKETTKKEKQE